MFPVAMFSGTQRAGVLAQSPDIQRIGSSVGHDPIYSAQSSILLAHWPLRHRYGEPTGQAREGQPDSFSAHEPSIQR